MKVELNMDLFDRPIAYHRAYVELTKSVTAAVMLSQAVYWQKRAKQEDGYWYKTIEEWEDETGLTRYEQQTARKKCSKYLKTVLKGIPAQLYYKVDIEVLIEDLFATYPQASLLESNKQVSDFVTNINKNTENTTENNTENTTDTFAEVVDIYQNNIGIITPILRDELLEIADTFPVEWFKMAVKEAVTREVRNLKYVRAILDRWKVEGFKQGKKVESISTEADRSKYEAWNTS